jgi:hypothetical protein
MPQAFWQAAGLLVLSNVFMTFAWYAHLKEVPGNRIGYTVMSLPQLKILQEVITLVVFVPFVVLYMKQGLRLDYLWAALCVVGAVYFVFRGA